jgi:uncharacterized membrane protein YesL
VVIVVGKGYGKGMGPFESLGLFKKSLFFIYEQMGNVFALSVIWLFTSVTVVLMPAVTATVYYTVNRVLDKEDAGFKDSFAAFKKYFWRATGVGLALGAMIAVLVVDMFFFVTVPQNIVLKALGGFMFWPLVFIALSMNYVIPLLVVQDISVGLAMKRAALLVLDNLTFTLVLGLLSTLLTVLAVVVPPFTVLAFAGTLGCLQVSATRSLLATYKGGGKLG